MTDHTQLQSKLRLLKQLRLMVPLSSLIIFFGVLYLFAELDPALSTVIAVVFASMEWLFFSGAVKKVENELKTIG